LGPGANVIEKYRSILPQYFNSIKTTLITSVF